MTPEEIKEYHILADKRDNGSLTKKEHKRWKRLVEKSFFAGIPSLTKTWMEGFQNK